MVIKSHDDAALLRDIEETFRTLTHAQMKLNPGNCTFGVEEGQFMGYQINKEGIALNQDNVQEFLESKAPYNINGV